MKIDISNEMYGIRPNGKFYDHEEMTRIQKEMNSLKWKYMDFKDKRVANMTRGRLENRLGVNLVVYEYNYLMF